MRRVEHFPESVVALWITVNHLVVALTQKVQRHIDTLLITTEPV